MEPGCLYTHPQPQYTGLWEWTSLLTHFPHLQNVDITYLIGVTRFNELAYRNYSKLYLKYSKTEYSLSLRVLPRTISCNLEMSKQCEKADILTVWRLVVVKHLGCLKGLYFFSVTWALDSRSVTFFFLAQGSYYFTLFWVLFLWLRS